jgi:hypothetical protein
VLTIKFALVHCLILPLGNICTLLKTQSAIGEYANLIISDSHKITLFTSTIFTCKELSHCLVQVIYKLNSQLESVLELLIIWSFKKTCKGEFGSSAIDQITFIKLFFSIHHSTGEIKLIILSDVEE